MIEALAILIQQQYVRARSRERLQAGRLLHSIGGIITLIVVM